LRKRGPALATGFGCLLTGILLAVVCPTAAAQSPPVRVSPATFRDTPLVLSGTDSLVITQSLTPTAAG